MIVIFHSQDGQNHCDDGFAAAWVFRQKYGGEAEFLPGVYGTEPPFDLCPGRTFALVDFSYKRQPMLRLMHESARVIVLDHHKTAQADLEGIAEQFADEEAKCGLQGCLEDVHVEFDMDRSGARMAWDYCFPGKEPPELLKRIEAIRRFIEVKVTELKRTAWRAEVGGVEMPVCNAPWFLASELAGQLAENDGDGRAAVYFDQPKRRVFSLRARKGADVSEIAKRYGGGGHPGAAGFEVPRP